MFWGWYSFNNGPRSSGCFFLPFLCVCGSPFLFSGFNSRFLLPLLLIGAMGLIIPAILNRGAPREVYAEDWNDEMADGEKPKRDSDEKPKRSGESLYRDDEVVDAPRAPIQPDYDEI